MNQLDLERKSQDKKERKPFVRYAPLVSAVIAIGMAALPLEAQTRPRPRAEQCSASVQSGTIPGYLINGNHVTLLSTPLMRENSYLSISMPESYMTRLRTAVSARPEAERQGKIADIFQNNIQIAYARLGTASNVTFDCAPLDGTLPPIASASASARPSGSARQAPSAVPSASARPAASADPLSNAQPSVTAQPQPSASPDAGVPQQRHRAIQP
jgi:hypothetical protein